MEGISVLSLADLRTAIYIPRQCTHHNAADTMRNVIRECLALFALPTQVFFFLFLVGFVFFTVCQTAVLVSAAVN